MVVFTGWSFASSCFPPRLSATQFLSAKKGQLPFRSGLSPDCCCVLVGALEGVCANRLFAGPLHKGLYKLNRTRCPETS